MGWHKVTVVKFIFTIKKSKINQEKTPVEFQCKMKTDFSEGSFWCC